MATLIASRHIETVLEKLESNKRKLRPKMDLVAFRNSLYSDMVRIRYHLKEINAICARNWLEDGQPEAIDEQLNSTQRIINLIITSETVEDVTNIINQMEAFKNFFKEYIIDISEYALQRGPEVKNSCKKLYNYDYMPSSVDLTYLGEKLASQNKRMMNVFDPNCKDGHVLRAMCFDNPSFSTYGLNIDNYSLSDTARNYIQKTIKGGGFGSAITNDAFDVVTLCPDILYTNVKNKMGINMQSPEMDQIKDNYRFLRQQGLYVIILPFYRLDLSMSTLLSKQLKDVQVYRMNTQNPNYNFNMHYVAVIGRKQFTKDKKEEEFTKLVNVDYNLLDRINDYNAESKLDLLLPPETLLIKSFKGSVFEESDIQNVIDSSGLYDSLFDELSYVKNIKDRSPLLPFNLGQIGLVLTSGELDGIVNGPDGSNHVIKGRVTKITKIEERTSDDNKTIEERKVQLNQVQINIITPDGNFKQLT